MLELRFRYVTGLFFMPDFFTSNGSPTREFIQWLFKEFPPEEGYDYTCVNCKKVRMQARDRVRKFRSKLKESK